MKMNINVMMANTIKPDSWLNDERYEWFRTGYNYAANSTNAIPALSKVSPEELYYAVTSILYGAEGDIPYTSREKK